MIKNVLVYNDSCTASTSTSTPATPPTSSSPAGDSSTGCRSEANYLDLGTASDRIEGIDIETDVGGISLAALGFLPIGPVDLFAKVGAVNWDADVTARGFGISGSDSGTDLTYGAGAQFRVWSPSIRGEYEIFDVADADTLDMISVSFTWTFH